MDLPVVDISQYLLNSDDDESCFIISSALEQYGACLVRDPRITFKDNEAFLDLMTDYFELPCDERLKDVRKEFGYQVGATPGFTEDPKCSFDQNCQKVIDSLEDKPSAWNGPDPKWRFFWRIGDCLSAKYSSLTANPVIPELLKSDWEDKMNRWGGLLADLGMTICEMAAIGFGHQKDTFTRYTSGGPHLLAPTGCDLLNVKEGDVLAAFHYDLNFLTLHGKARFPGLYIWARNTGKKIPVKIPGGTILIQAGKQLEYVTGGKVVAGYHEVVADNSAIAKRDKARICGTSLWRASSTVFLHAHPDTTLKPVIGENPNYPPIITGDFVQNELRGIKLMEQ
eukprot:NODE_21_length_42443_cov_0.822808.p11 type:complete len:339 gc:universal NODE_21_length_42443_cov_0.822808:12606-11590(-)